MSVLDGNAIAGLLHEVFGHEMTAARGVCAHCGAEGAVGEFVVHSRAPGVVARCRACSGVLLVIVVREEIACVDLMGLAALER